MTYRCLSDALDLLDRFYSTIARPERSSVFVSTLTRECAAAELDDAFRRIPAGRLTGMIIAVKDNVDVLGFDTTAACPGYRYSPADDAAVVAELRAEGAVVIGKTNLDQFATGLVGTRSPYGPVSDVRHPSRISGGSSSGSAAAVGLDIVDAALGTDTAGSGRIPAALQGIVGIKPTYGTVSNRGLVPACASYDCITVFARTLSVAESVMHVMARSGARVIPGNIRFTAPVNATIGVPSELPNLSESWRSAFAQARARLVYLGFQVREIDLSPSLAAATMLYDSPLVAERAAAVGQFVSDAPSDSGLDPTVQGIVEAASTHGGAALLRAREELAERKVEAMIKWEDCDAIMIPTAPSHPDISMVHEDPVGVNAVMGTYTNFCNLFDLSAVAVPAGTVGDGGSLGSDLPAQFGVTFLGEAFADDLITGIARTFVTNKANTVPAGSWLTELARTTGAAVPLAVFGAHLSGQPLNHKLLERGAVRRGPVRTTADYLLFALDTTPEKPGLTGPVRMETLPIGTETGVIAGEEWLISPVELSTFLASLPHPMALGQVNLDDGRSVTGFTFQPAELGQSWDITSTGGWVAHLTSRTPLES